MKRFLLLLMAGSALLMPTVRAHDHDDDDSDSNLPHVSVTASDPVAFGSLSTGAFVLYRDGTNGELNVTLSYGGTASNGVDYVTLPTSVKIPDGFHAVGLTVTPINGGDLTQTKWVQATIVEADTYKAARKHATVQIRANAFENDAPEVTITAPTNNASFGVHSDITITADVSDDGGDPKVSFFANDKFLGSLTEPPYTLVWSNAPAGKFALFARAQDAFGKSGVSAAVHITVTNPPPTPGSIKLTAPSNGASFAAGSNIDVAATVTGNTNITSVSFTANGNAIGSATAAPYSITWSNVAAGVYQLRAKATGSDGTLVSPPIMIKVTNPPPTVSITAPADQSTVAAGANVDITATATAASGTISKVSIYGDGQLLAKLSTAPYSVTWSNVPPGMHKIIAAAVDSNGTIGYASVTITASNTPPTVKLTAPADGSTIKAGTKFELKADASDPDGIRWVVFWRNDAPIALKSSAPYTVNTTILIPGTYKIAAEAFDKFGARTKSDPVTITVTAP
jgi:hypothetical protein